MSEQLPPWPASAPPQPAQMPAQPQMPPHRDPPPPATQLPAPPPPGAPQPDARPPPTQMPAPPPDNRPGLRGPDDRPVVPGNTVPSAETPLPLWRDERAGSEAPGWEMDREGRVGVQPLVFPDKGPQDPSQATTTYPPGPALIDMSVIASGGGHSAVTNITAHAGGGQANATPLTAGINRVTTCATAADSVALPRAVGGQIIAVYNGGAAAMQIFAAVGSSDTINSVAGSTGVSLVAAKGAFFCSSGPGSWFWNLSA